MSAPRNQRPRWMQALLWAALAFFAFLLVRELGAIFKPWRLR